MQEVTQFIVIAPGAMGKAVEYAKGRIQERLGRSFPGYRFQIEPFGPLAEADEFTVLPVMGQVRADSSDPDRIYMCKPLEPWVIPAIKDVLREFELAPELN